MSSVVTASGDKPATDSESATSPLSAKIAWLIIATIAVGILALIVGAPLAQASNHPQFAAAVYKTFSYVCHQRPDRSFFLEGHQFGVCSRCTGLYAGFAAATLIYPVARSLRNTDAPRLGWLILAALPLAIDFSLGYFGVWGNTHLSRFVTGVLFGSVAVFFIVPGLVQLSQMIAHRRTANG